MDSKNNFYVENIFIRCYENISQNKPKILFVHGAWHDSWYWEENFLPYFYSKGYSCYAFDLRSHGRSKPTGKNRMRFISLNDYVKDLDKVVKYLTVNSRVVLVGHSMGGLIVQKYLQRQDKSIDSAVLLAPATAKGVFGVTIKIMFHHPLLYLKMNLFMSLYPLMANYKLFKKYLFYSETNEEKLKNYQSLVQNESYRAYINMIYTRINKKKISIPILIIGGEKDEIFPKKQIMNLGKKLSAKNSYYS
jgi:hypothetical protein